MNRWENNLELYHAIGKSLSYNIKNKQLLRCMVNDSETESKEQETLGTMELLDIQQDIYLHCISDDKYDPDRSKLITYINHIVYNYLKNVKRNSGTFDKSDIVHVCLDSDINKDDSSSAQFEIASKDSPEQILVQHEECSTSMKTIESIYDEVELLYLDDEISIDDLSVSKNMSVAWTKRMLCKKKKEAIKMLKESPEDTYEAKELLEQIQNIMTDDELAVIIGNTTVEGVAKKNGVLPESIERRIRRKRNQIKEELL